MCLPVRSSTAMQVADADAAAATLHCECVFVEPLGWMGELHGKSGVLKCPECAKQLGFFDWTGASYVSRLLLPLLSRSRAPGLTAAACVHVSSSALSQVLV